MDKRIEPANQGKFIDPAVTADGSARATVALTRPTTLWFNTGTLCNITCEGCYIESSPTNDRLSYLTVSEVADYLDQIAERGWPVREIGFTGGEPFMNPDFLAMMRQSLASGYEVLVLTNAMKPMQRPHVAAQLSRLIEEAGTRITLRVSLDHWTEEGHDAVRGAGSWARGCGSSRRARHFSRNGPERGGARDHDGLLGHPAQIARGRHVFVVPHGRETQRRTALGRRLHASALRSRVRHGPHIGRGRAPRRAEPPALRQVLCAGRRVLFGLTAGAAHCGHH
jgi:hypothetical protein